MLVAFSPIFVQNTKIIFVHYFVAPLSTNFSVIGYYYLVTIGRLSYSSN